MKKGVKICIGDGEVMTKSFKIAFSLAEVLITLGIIGVVSALLLPTVNSYFKVKKLETQFKTADSLIQQALKGAVSELGYDDIKDLHLDYLYKPESYWKGE